MSTALAVLSEALPLTTVSCEDLGISGEFAQESVWLTTERDIALVNKGSKAKVVTLFHSLRSFPEMVRLGTFVGLSTIAKITRYSEKELKGGSHLKRAVDLLVNFGVPCTVKYERSTSRKKAPRGNKILGVTFDIAKDASVDGIRSVRVGRVDPLQLAAAQQAGLRG